MAKKPKSFLLIRGNKKQEVERIERILNKIKLIWDKSPELGLLQLIDNLRTDIFDNPFYLDDKELEKRLDNCIIKNGITK